MFLLVFLTIVHYNRFGFLFLFSPPLLSSSSSFSRPPFAVSRTLIPFQFVIFSSIFILLFSHYHVLFFHCVSRFICSTAIFISHPRNLLTLITLSLRPVFCHALSLFPVCFAFIGLLGTKAASRGARRMSVGVEAPVKGARYGP